MELKDKDSPAPLLCFLVEELLGTSCDGWLVRSSGDYQDEMGMGMGGFVPTWHNLLPFAV
jgi:hypothetical protein